MIALLVGLALSTLISEDLASIGAGLLAREGHVALVPAVSACIVGVYAGDLGLWAVGRVLGPAVTRISWLPHALGSTDIAVVRSQIQMRFGTAILVSRFVPGSRLPMYVALGVWGQRPLAFALWSLVAVGVWTPALVIATTYLGDALVLHVLMGIKAGAVASLLTAIALLGVTKLAGRGLTRLMRRYHHRLAQTIDTPI